MTDHHVLSTRRGRGDDEELCEAAARLGFPGLHITSTDLYFVRGVDADGARALAAKCLDEPFRDPCAIDEVDTPPSGALVVEVGRRAGVTDRVAAQLSESAAMIGLAVEAATGARHVIEGAADLTDRQLARLVESLLANPVIETWSLGAVSPGFAGDADSGTEPADATVALRGLDASALERLGRERGLALDPAELVALQRYFADAGREPTVAEVETLAQTWSEHCAHKTFRASIAFDDDATTDGATEGIDTPSLLERLRRSTIAIVQQHTERTGRSFVVSAFDGNAGIVHFDGLPPLAIKVETHNHPSAVEPFGGANTGVGGVVRDVLAAPAEPIALTDVLCFAPRDLHPGAVPEGVLHPSLIEEGVVAGVADYGNKIGVPTVAGAVMYDEGFVGNPLVFCGCVGRVLEGAARIGTPRAGDRVIVIGGATGRDGIKGATFSSMTMDATTGEVAGASVQIGDPIVERLVGDVLVGLLDREQPLCTALTDCGAGGLSSAVGEMADGIGAVVQLDDVPRKYPGLAAWEVWLSEAQERMVLAVAPADVAAVRAACTRLDVGCADIGEFTGSGRVVVQSGTVTVVDLPTEFLHHGRPRRHMRAVRPNTASMASSPRPVVDHCETLLALLAHPTIASKEAIIRRYDHEVRGATVVGPMSAPCQTGPSDGVVVAEPTSAVGFALGIGVNPRYGLYDCERMAWSAVDEAMRNVVAVGADPAQVALLDNFSWGDPRRPETLGDLVAAVDGCITAAHDFAAPFVSGKDSLNNEYEGVDGHRRSIPPTLVVTALAQVPDADRAPSTAFSTPGNAVVLVGATRDELRGSHLDIVLGSDYGGSVPSRDEGAPQRYAALHRLIVSGQVRSAHDVSEGGLAVTLAEAVIGGGCGADVDLSAVHPDTIVAMHSESNGRLVVEVDPSQVDAVCAELDHAIVIGTVTADTQLRIAHGGSTLVEVSAAQMTAAWNGGAV